MKKFYLVPAEIIESNFPDDLDIIKRVSEVIYKEQGDIDEIKEKMSQYLSNDEGDYDRVIEVLTSELERSPNRGLDFVEEIEVWEKVEGRFTVKEFCELVGIKL